MSKVGIRLPRWVWVWVISVAVVIGLGATTATMAIVAFTSRVKGTNPVTQSGASARLRADTGRERTAAARRHVAMWAPRQHGGAVRAFVPTNGGSPPPSCAPSRLSTQYWTSVPGMALIVSGFNVINQSNSACTLPAYPSQVALAGADGGVLSPVSLPTPDGKTSSHDFVNYPSAPDWIPSTMVDFASDTAPLTLLPGGEAVVLLYAEEMMVGAGPPPSTCINAPAGGGLGVTLGTSANSAIVVPVPTASQLVSTLDPAGSAFTSCTAVLVSPFLTWHQAAAIVGTPTPTSSAGPLPLADEQIYVNAP
ncbi:MAG: hypothetical protein ACYDGN_11040 [Acidimicrobiales bacterium]